MNPTEPKVTPEGNQYQDALQELAEKLAALCGEKLPDTAGPGYAMGLAIKRLKVTPEGIGSLIPAIKHAQGLVNDERPQAEVLFALDTILKGAHALLKATPEPLGKPTLSFNLDNPAECIAASGAVHALHDAGYEVREPLGKSEDAVAAEGILDGRYPFSVHRDIPKDAIYAGTNVAAYLILVGRKSEDAQIWVGSPEWIRQQEDEKFRAAAEKLKDISEPLGKSEDGSKQVTWPPPYWDCPNDSSHSLEFYPRWQSRELRCKTCLIAPQFTNPKEGAKSEDAQLPRFLLPDNEMLGKQERVEKASGITLDQAARTWAWNEWNNRATQIGRNNPDNIDMAWKTARSLGEDLYRTLRRLREVELAALSVGKGQDFEECDVCKAKSGSPLLCLDCVRRRATWYASRQGVGKAGGESLSETQQWQAVILGDKYISDIETGEEGYNRGYTSGCKDGQDGKSVQLDGIPPYVAPKPTEEA